MTRPTINTYYMSMAFLASTRAGCPKRRVGCVITDKNNRVLATGYNSPPRKLPTCFEVYCGADVDNYPCIAAHAEIATITSCRSIQEAHNMYITCSPCVSCIQLIMTTNIENLFFAEIHKSWKHTKTIWTGHWRLIKGFEKQAILTKEHDVC